MDDLPANRLRVLIVEDDRITARDLEETLKRRGFIIAGVAYSAAEVPAIVSSKQPEIALLNIDLDNTSSGIGLAKELREKHNIPVIFITGYSEETLHEKAREAKPAGFIRKPFSDDELTACLESVVEHNVASERLSERLPSIEEVSAHVSQGVIATDLDDKVVYLNAAAESMTGWSREESIGAALATIMPIDRSNSNRTSFKSRNGLSHAIAERSEPIKADDGEALGVVTVVEILPEKPAPDVSEGLPDKSEAESAKKESNPTETLPPARSAAVQKIAELSRDPAFRSLIKNRETPQPSVASETSTPPEPTLPSVFSESAESIFTAAGASLIDDFGDPLIRINEDGTISDANAEARTVFNDGKPLVDQDFWSFFSEQERENYMDQIDRPLVDGRRHRFDFHDSSHGRWFEVRNYRTAGGILALFTDITSSKLETAESVRQQRLEGLGLLARGFAHDFNNHLTAITGNISLAKERYQEDAELQQMLSEAQSAATGATGLVQQLMTFARGGRPIRKRTRISEVIRRILNEQRLQHPDIRYQFQAATIDLVANVDPAQIGRLVENLVSNSAIAMPNGGVLIIRCERVQPEQVIRIRGSHTPEEQDHLLIEVIDTGIGMSETALARVFEPYFTTRKEDNASGIGLTVCESIAKAHGGFIQLQSKEGKGTIATFCAPLGLHASSADEKPPRASYPNFDIPNLTEKRKTPTQSEPILVGTRILILEDDAPIRRLMAATLRRAGHEVVETKDGRETIAIYRDSMERDEKFHLLICDLTIENGVGGVETMRQLVEMDPEVLAIVSSGYSDAPAMSNPSGYGFKGVLPKPYAPSELRAAVHRILVAHRIIS
jgi:PAS domain S-box-containing protein